MRTLLLLILLVLDVIGCDITPLSADARVDPSLVTAAVGSNENGEIFYVLIPGAVAKVWAPFNPNGPPYMLMLASTALPGQTETIIIDRGLVLVLVFDAGVYREYSFDFDLRLIAIIDL